MDDTERKVDGMPPSLFSFEGPKAMAKSAEQLEDTLKKKRVKKTAVKAKNLLGSGSTLINLACSGTPFGAFAKGTFNLLVGDSDSGKTFLANTCFAEAAINQYFDDYRFIYDNGENGALMDVAAFFGKEVERRLEPPAYDDEGEPNPSRAVQEFYFNVNNAIKEGKPFIYVQDSENVLGSDEEDEKFDEWQKAHEEGKEAKGSMTDGKAKFHSQRLRKVKNKLAKTGSILIMISQTRDNLGAGYAEKTRSGGKALKFYATIELWSSVKENLKKRVKGKDRQIGILARIQVKKNHLIGRKRDVEVPIYHSLGFDDIGSCVDYLLDEKHWKKKKGGGVKKGPKKSKEEQAEEDKGAPIIATEFEFEGSREALIRHIEENDLERQLQMLVGRVWNDIEEACAVDRKPRYE